MICARLQHLPAAERQQPARQLGAALAGGRDHVGRLLQVGARFEGDAQGLGIADDDRQEIVEVVREPARELADRLHLLRLRQLFFGALALAEVMNDADEDRAALLLRLADRQVDRECRAVLALADDLAADADDLGLMGMQVVGEVAVVLPAIGRGHQHLDVLADHFFGAIAEQTLTRGIEHKDAAGGVDQDDPVDGSVYNRVQPRLFAAVRHDLKVPTTYS